MAYPGATGLAAPLVPTALSPANVNSLSFTGFAARGPVCRPPLPDITNLDGTTGPGAASDPFAIDAGAPPSMTDADHNGLLDHFEALFGTDPTKADTDGDGLSDAYETSVRPTPGGTGGASDLADLTH